MTYSVVDTSSQDARPVYLYAFTDAAGTTRLTNAASAVTYDGNSYSVSSISHGEITQSGEMSKDALSLDFPSNNAFARTFLVSQLDASTTLTIIRLHTTDLDAEGVVYWKGRVASAKASGQTITLECESIFTSMRRPGLRARYQRTCRHDLYGTGCGLDPENFDVSGTVSAISGKVITVAVADDQADGYYRGGMVRAEDGTLRGIREHVGQLLTLSSTASIANGDTVQLYPGCDRLTETCRVKFSNLLNYGGFPEIPSDNPFNIQLF